MSESACDRFELSQRESETVRYSFLYPSHSVSGTSVEGVRLVQGPTVTVGTVRFGYSKVRLKCDDTRNGRPLEVRFYSEYRVSRHLSSVRLLTDLSSLSSPRLL